MKLYMLINSNERLTERFHEVGFVDWSVWHCRLVATNVTLHHGSLVLRPDLTRVVNSFLFDNSETFLKVIFLRFNFLSCRLTLLEVCLQVEFYLRKAIAMMRHLQTIY